MSHQHRSLSLWPKTWVVDSNDLQLGGGGWGGWYTLRPSKSRGICLILKKNPWTIFGSKYAKTLQLTCSHLPVQKKKRREKNPATLEFMGGNEIVFETLATGFLCFISISELLIQHRKSIDLCHIKSHQYHKGPSQTRMIIISYLHLHNALQFPRPCHILCGFSFDSCVE